MSSSDSEDKGQGQGRKRLRKHILTQKKRQKAGEEVTPDSGRKLEVKVKSPASHKDQGNGEKPSSARRARRSPRAPATEYGPGERSRIQEVLNTFKDDVVRVKSSDRNKWQAKLDALQEQRLKSRSQLALFQQGTGPNLKRDEPPMKSWAPEPESPRSSAESSSGSAGTSCSASDVGASICHYASGILAGLLFWHALFGVSEGGTKLCPFIIYWTLSTVLVLVTVVGFLSRICMQPAPAEDGPEGGSDSTGFGGWLLHLTPVALLLTLHYVNKALSLRDRECRAYLALEDRGPVTLTYPCNAVTLQRSLPNQLLLVGLPTLAALFIYTFLHLRRVRG